jgi:hypothetical protein
MSIESWANLKRFHNPHSESTARLILDYTDKGITKGWSRAPGGVSQVRKTLDDWVKLRGEAAFCTPAFSR